MLVAADAPLKLKAKKLDWSMGNANQPKRQEAITSSLAVNSKQSE
jgi:hypothetical protein